MKYLIILISFLHSVLLYAFNVDNLDQNRSDHLGKKILITGIVSKYKIEENKKNKIIKFNLKSKFSKNYLKVSYFVKKYNKSINSDPKCLSGQIAIVKGNYLGKNTGVNLGDLIVDFEYKLKCFDDLSYKKITEDTTVENLSFYKKENDKKHIKVKGFIHDLKIRNGQNTKKATFNLLDKNKSKHKLKVSLLISENEDVINDFNCEYGQFVILTGVFFANLKSKTRLGDLKIISKELVKCKDQKIELSATEKIKNKKNINKYMLKELKRHVRLYIKKISSYKEKVDADELKTLIVKIKNICDLYKTQKIELQCAKMTYILRAVEQRNSLSFRINSAMNNMSGWEDLKLFRLKRKNNVLNIIKSLYPADSDYIIGIPARCYPDQQFNPSASNFPYKELKVSKYAKDNFTAILHKFNDPSLKCKNLMGSIFFVGNMDDDPDLEVIKIDTDMPRLIRIIKSDIR